MNEPSQAELWARFAAASMSCAEKGDQIEIIAEDADHMLEEFHKRFDIALHEGEEYWYLRRPH